MTTPACGALRGTDDGSLVGGPSFLVVLKKCVFLMMLKCVFLMMLKYVF
jgi:hypothetical protein